MERKPRKEIKVHVATGRERLERLARSLDALAPEKLRLSRWYGQGKGCAIGWAALSDPWFQGLRLERDNSLKDCRPVYGNKTDWQAVLGFFEIGYEDVIRLFVPAAYGGAMQPHPKRVAAKIRAFLAEAQAAA